MFTARYELRKCHAVVQSVSHRPLTADARVRFTVSPCEICGGQSGTETGFPLLLSFLECCILNVV